MKSKGSTTKGGLSVVVMMLLNNSNAIQLHQQSDFIRQEDVSFAKKFDNQFVDINNIGSKMSALSLTMLDKENSQPEGPQENLLIQTELVTEQKTQSEIRQQNQLLLFQKMNQQSNQDDLDDGDVMAASASIAVNDNKKKDEDEDGEAEAPKPEPKPDAIQDASTAEDLNLGTSGGLMDALMDKDPAAEFSEEHLAQVEADKKTSKKEIAKRLAEAKKRETKKAAEKKKKEAAKKKKAAAAAKKKKEKKEKEEKEAADRLKKEEAMLKSFIADEELPKVPDPNDSYLDQGLKKTNSLSELADEQLAEQNLADSAKSIVKSAKKNMFKGMASGFDLLG